MDNREISIFILAFIFSACAGIASVLRNKIDSTWKVIFSAFLNSGFAGLGVCLLWYLQLRENLYFLLGVCVMLGLGGPAMVDFVVIGFKRFIEMNNVHLRQPVKDKEETNQEGDIP